MEPREGLPVELRQLEELICSPYVRGILRYGDGIQALYYYERAAAAGDTLGRLGAAWLLVSGGEGHVKKDVKKAMTLLLVSPC